MQFNVAKRLTPGRLTVLVSAFVVIALGTNSRALATCGDYLVHGKLVHLERDSYDAMQRVSETASHLGLRDRPAMPSSKPISACEGGRCHSKPVPPPVDSTRIIIPKHSAVVWLASDACHEVDAPWARPVDGIVAEQPFLAIASPPPRRLSFCA